MSTSTMHAHWNPRTENRVRIYRPRERPLIVADRLKQEAAGMFRRTFDNANGTLRSAKSVAPYIAPQELTALRNGSGCIGRTAVLMLADPQNALTYAEHLYAVARSVTMAEARPLALVLCEEMRADAEEDIAQDDLRVEASPENLRAYIAAAKRAKAKLTEAIDAAEAELADMEAER